VGDQRCQVKAFLHGQPRDLFPDFSQTHDVNLNRIATFGNVGNSRWPDKTYQLSGPVNLNALSLCLHVLR
jgi:hypothetical protein